MIFRRSIYNNKTLLLSSNIGKHAGNIYEPIWIKVAAECQNHDVKVAMIQFIELITFDEMVCERNEYIYSGSFAFTGCDKQVCFIVNK